VTHPYRVVDVTCQADPVPLHGRVGLSAKRFTQAATMLRKLRPGMVVRTSASMGWPDVAGSIGGVPELVRGGKITLRGCVDRDFCGWNPRTGIGVKADGTVLLVVVDGRRAGWSSRGCVSWTSPGCSSSWGPSRR